MVLWAAEFAAAVGAGANLSRARYLNDDAPFMKYSNIAPGCGLQVSKLILGCMGFGAKQWQPWVVERDEAFSVLRAAWKSGITTFDTANAYSNGESERILGAWMKQDGIPRDEVVIMTKVYFYSPQDKPGVLGWSPEGAALAKPNQRGLSRKAIHDEVEKSLKNLQTDYIDVYQIHRFDYGTPVEETMEALHDLVKSGKVRYIGASSMYAHQLWEMQLVAKERGWTTFVSMQNLYNALYREEEREMLPSTQKWRMGIVPWSPLARGALSHDIDDARTVRTNTDPSAARFHDTTNENFVAIRRVIQDIAKKRGVSNTQVALAWLLSKPNCAPIVGPTRPGQPDDLVKAVDLQLTADEIKAIEAPYQPQGIIGHV